MPTDRGSDVLTIEELAEYLKISKFKFRTFWG